MSDKPSDQIRLTPLTPQEIGVRNGGKFVTLDKQGRLSLSSELRRELGVLGVPAHLYVSKDVAQKVIGVVKHDVIGKPVNAALMKMDKRGYANGRPLLRQFGLPQVEGPYRFEYIGKIDSEGAYWHAFRYNTK